MSLHIYIMLSALPFVIYKRWLKCVENRSGVGDVQAVLVIGTKLQHVVATLALENTGVHGPFIGVLLKPRDQLFWFNRPKWLLYLLHLILFEVCILFTHVVYMYVHYIPPNLSHTENVMKILKIKVMKISTRRM